ncbi:MAG: hypothetical protein WKG07_44020 [Hymenobacter sp.]
MVVTYRRFNPHLFPPPHARFYYPRGCATLTRRALAGLVFLIASLGWQGATAQSMLQASGTKIVNASDQEVILNGMNLGGWTAAGGLHDEARLRRHTQGSVKKMLYDAGLSDAAVETFYQGYRDNFITKPDIDYIASQGFNCVRLPLHYDLFLTPAPAGSAQQRDSRHRDLRGLRGAAQNAGTMPSSSSRTPASWKPFG